MPAHEPLVLPPGSTPLGLRLEVALALCDAADGIALQHFRNDLHIEAKPDRSFVTQADIAIERLIRDRIGGALPRDGLVGEEFGVTEGAGEIRWIIDPIDGTHNFMRGVPLFGTLIGVEIGGELAVGVMSAPALGTRWFAWTGGGTWEARLADGTWDRASARRLRVSGVERLEDAQLLYSSVPSLLDSGLVPGFPRVVRQVWRDRGFGDFWGYGLVAGGMAEAMVEIGPKSWDLAAPSVIVREAGGRLSNLDGRLDLSSEGLVVASNGRLHDQLLEELQRA